MTTTDTCRRNNQQRNVAPRTGYETYFDDDDNEIRDKENTQVSPSNHDSPPPPDDNNNNNHNYYYSLASDAGPLHPSCPLTLDQIHKVLEQRRHCQANRNYKEADRLLRGLHHAKVYCHDERREFRADGVNSFGAAPLVSYRRRGWMPAHADLPMIASLVMERSRAKKQRHFGTADAIEQRLLQEYQVQVDDARREWSFVLPLSDTDTTSYYVPSPLGNEHDSHHLLLDAATHAIIQQQLHDRCVARRSKQYALADAIRDALLQEYSVVVDDRTREYKVVTGTLEEDEDAFVAQAQASQRSAFARTQKQQQQQQQQQQQIQRQDDNDDDETDLRLDLEIRSILQQKDVEPPTQQSLESSSNVAEEKAATNTELELSTLTVVALKEKLREAGLPVGGRKAELIDRLQNNGLSTL